MQEVRKLQGPTLRDESFQRLKKQNRTLRTNSLFTGESESLSPETEGGFGDLYKRGAMQNMLKQGEAESVWGQEQMALREGMLSVFVTGDNLSSIGFL